MRRAEEPERVNGHGGGMLSRVVRNHVAGVGGKRFEGGGEAARVAGGRPDQATRTMVRRMTSAGWTSRTLPSW